VEGIDTDIGRAPCREMLDAQTLAGHGAEADAILGVYRLHYIL